MTAKNSKNKTEGIRITSRGKITIAELRAQLLTAVTKLQNSGITHVSSLNLYVSPCDEQGYRVTPHVNGHRLKAIILDLPYRSAADEHGL